MIGFLVLAAPPDQGHSSFRLDDRLCIQACFIAACEWLKKYPKHHTFPIRVTTRHSLTLSLSTPATSTLQGTCTRNSILFCWTACINPDFSRSVSWSASLRCLFEHKHSSFVCKHCRSNRDPISLFSLFLRPAISLYPGYARSSYLQIVHTLVLARIRVR